MTWRLSPAQRDLDPIIRWSIRADHCGKGAKTDRPRSLALALLNLWGHEDEYAEIAARDRFAAMAHEWLPRYSRDVYNRINAGRAKLGIAVALE